MNITHITSDIVEIPVQFFNKPWATRAYLIINQATNTLLLIDTGSAGSEWRIIQAIQAAGYQPDNLEAILITHWHEDHTGSLGAMMAAAGENVRVLVPAAEIDIIRNQVPLPILNWGWAAKLGTQSLPPGLLTPTQITRLEALSPSEPLLADWDLQLINTPGHSEGHISLFSPSRKALFAGDALVGYKRNILTLPHHNPHLTEKTAEQLLTLDFEWLLPGHCHALPYRAAPSDRQAVTTPPKGWWYLLEKSLTIRRLAHTTGPALSARPNPTTGQQGWLALGLLIGAAALLSLWKGNYQAIAKNSSQIHTDKHGF